MKKSDKTKTAGEKNNHLSTDVRDLTKTVHDLTKTVGGLTTDVRDLTKTISNLASAVAKGFEGVDKRFEKMATKTDLRLVEQRLGGKIDGIRRSMDNEINVRKDIKNDIKKIKEHVGMSA